MSKQNLNQSQSQKQQQVISQQTVQLMRLVEMSNLDLEQEIIKSVDENPALELDSTKNEDDIHNHQNDNDLTDEDIPSEIDNANNDDPFDNEFFGGEDFDDEIPDYRLYTNNHSRDEERTERVVVFADSLQEKLLQQLGELNISPRTYEIGEYIIGNLDDNGYLHRDSQALANELLFNNNLQTSAEEVEQTIVECIQELEPAGVCARTVQECLLIQLRHKEETESVLLAKTILDKHFDSFSKKQYDKISKSLNINDLKLKEALDEIKKLQAYPASNDSIIDKQSSLIIPDFIVSAHDGKLELSLNNTYLPKVKIYPDFKKEYHFLSQEKNDKLRAEAEKFLKSNLEDAQNFINMLSLREMILYNTMLAIMKRQENFFLTGNELELKPMVLKDIAEDVNLDISTVSRVTSSKYAQTFFGTILLKSLFSEALGEDNVSSKAVKKALSELIDGEDKSKPLGDERLVELLKEQGFDIARRTVAKYREQLGYSVARLRKEI